MNTRYTNICRPQLFLQTIQSVNRLWGYLFADHLNLWRSVSDKLFNIGFAVCGLVSMTLFWLVLNLWTKHMSWKISESLKLLANIMIILYILYFNHILHALDFYCIWDGLIYIFTFYVYQNKYAHNAMTKLTPCVPEKHQVSRSW